MTEKALAEDSRSEDFALMERRDEEQILAELKGAYLQEFVYDFTVGSRKVTGLSWAGVKEIAYRMGGVRVDDLDIQDKGEYWIVTAKAVDVTRNASRFGVSTQSKVMKLRSGESVPDDFAVQKAVSKAQRNAIRALIPEVFVKTCLAQFLAEKGQVPPIIKESSATELPPRKVDTASSVKPPESPAYKPHRFDKPSPADEAQGNAASFIADTLQEAGLDPDGVEVASRDWGLFEIKPLAQMSSATWNKYHEALKPLGTEYHPKGKAGDSYAGSWTVKVEAS